MNVKFVKNIRITGDLVCLTGLHIGSVKDSLGIGGGGVGGVGGVIGGVVGVLCVFVYGMR